MGFTTQFSPLRGGVLYELNYNGKMVAVTAFTVSPFSHERCFYACTNA